MPGEFGRVRFEDIDARTSEPRAKQIGGEVLKDRGWVIVHHDNGRTEIPTHNVISIDYPKEKES